MEETTMLLSRYAEALFWAGRYIERAEATARMVQVHTELFLDLPRAAGIGWSPLLAVAGAGEEFFGRHDGPDEDQVVAFLTADPDNRGSVIASVTQARENLAVARVLLPVSCWEVANDLHSWTSTSGRAATTRHTRLAWLHRVIGECQRLTGSLAGIMCEDEGYAFLQLGRHLERADMTTRVLDVQAGILVGRVYDLHDDDANSYADVTWMSVLRSLAAHQMFRRSVGAGMSGTAAVRFLLQDPRFPRSVEHCLSAAARALPQLPRAQVPLAACAAVRRQLSTVRVGEDMTPLVLHKLVDELQVGINELAVALNRTYFHPVPEPAAVDRAVTAVPPVKAS